jgi:type IV pilus assembly protein PilB
VASRINQIDVNIMTAEDPVEYNLLGINQVLVRNEVGMTFAVALKAFPRQDPNITWSARSATSRPARSRSRPRHGSPRAFDAAHQRRAFDDHAYGRRGIEPFNVASAVNLIVAQRSCGASARSKQQHEYTPEEMHASASTRRKARSPRAPAAIPAPVPIPRGQIFTK